MGTLTNRLCIWCTYFCLFFLQWSPSRGMTQRSPATSPHLLATRLEWHTLCVRWRSLAPVSSIIVIWCNVYSMFSLEDTITFALAANVNSPMTRLSALGFAWVVILLIVCRAPQEGNLWGCDYHWDPSPCHCRTCGICEDPSRPANPQLCLGPAP